MAFNKKTASLLLTLLVTVPIAGYLYILNTWVVDSLPLKSQIPSVVVSTMDKREVALDTLIFKNAVIIFFTPSCEHCKAAMLDMNSFYAEYKRKINFIGISLNSHEATAEFIKKYTITFPTYFDTTGNAKRQFHVVAVPAIFYVNRQKQLLKYQAGKQQKDYMNKTLSTFVSLPDDSVSASL